MKQLLLLTSLAFFLFSCGPKKDQAEEVKDEVIEAVEDAADETKDAVEEAADAATEAAETVKEEVKDATKEVVKEVKKMSGEWVGRVIDINAYAMGKDPYINRAKASELMNSGGLIGFMSDDVVYFVINTDGSVASRNLGVNADNTALKIMGKFAPKNGMNVIIADKFQ